MSDRLRLRLTRRQFAMASILATGTLLLAACAPGAPAAPTAAPAAPVPTSPPAQAVTVATAAPTAAPAAAPTAAAAAQPQIKRGGTLIHSTFTTYTTMDPHLNASFLNPGYDAIYSSLVRFELADRASGKFNVVGELADSWEQPNPTTLVFHLKKGVTFHDGSPFDASVAAWNFLRARDDPLSTRRSQLQVI